MAQGQGAGPKHSKEEVAKILLECTTDRDEAVAERHQIHVRSIQRWRVEMADNTELSQAIAAKKAILDAAWADQIPGALAASIDFLKRAAETANPADPDAIHSVAGAMKLLSEVAATWRILDARISESARRDGAADRPLVPAPSLRAVRATG